MNPEYKGYGRKPLDDYSMTELIDMLGEEVRPLLYTERGRLIDDRADAIAIGLSYAKQKEIIV